MGNVNATPPGARSAPLLTGAEAITSLKAAFVPTVTNMEPTSSSGTPPPKMHPSEETGRANSSEFAEDIGRCFISGYGSDGITIVKEIRKRPRVEELPLNAQIKGNDNFRSALENGAVRLSISPGPPPKRHRVRGYAPQIKLEENETPRRSQRARDFAVHPLHRDALEKKLFKETSELAKDLYMGNTHVHTETPAINASPAQVHRRSVSSEVNRSASDLPSDGADNAKPTAVTSGMLTADGRAQ
jgi:hypothetical protein